MIKFLTISLLFAAGSTYAQSRMATQAPVGEVSRSSSSTQVSAGYGRSSSSYSGSGSQVSSSSERMNSNAYHYVANTSNASYYSEKGHDHFGRVLYASNGISERNRSLGRIDYTIQRLELPRTGTALLVFETELLTVGDKASDNRFRHSGLGFLAGVFPETSTVEPPLPVTGNQLHPNYNPFYQSKPQLQNCDYNKQQFSYTCSLTGLNTGYLSGHRCNGCVGYYHYWRTYTNFGCFEYLNEHISKVQSVDELKTLIQSYYDCIDYYRQYDFLDPNTRARFRYGIKY